MYTIHIYIILLINISESLSQALIAEMQTEIEDARNDHSIEESIEETPSIKKIHGILIFRHNFLIKIIFVIKLYYLLQKIRQPW